MKLTTNFWSKFILFSLSALIIACGSEQNTNNENQTEETTTTEEVQEESMTSHVNFVMPSPLQVASIFKRAGLTYQEGLANDPNKVANYSSQLSKALNFGIYAADLSYCVLNNKSQESINYMKAVKQLSDDLGMTSIFGTDDLFSSFERNIGNEDSMIYILATVQENLDEHLENNEEQYMSVVFFAGGWTEGMYIGSMVANDGKHSVTGRLIEQMVILENMVEALEQYPHKSNELDNLIADFKAIDNMYKNFEAIKNQDKENISFENIKLTDEELKMLSAKINEMRTKIVNG